MKDWLVLRKAAADAVTSNDADDNGWLVWTFKDDATLSSSSPSWSELVESSVTWEEAVAFLAEPVAASETSTFRYNMIVSTNDNGDGSGSDGSSDGWCCVTAKVVSSEVAVAPTPPSIPSQYVYQLDLILTRPHSEQGQREQQDEQQYVVTISAVSVEHASTTVSAWLSWLKAAQSSSTATPLDVTIQAFASQPRQEFPPLVRVMSKNTTEPSGKKAGALSTLRFHFVSLDGSGDDDGNNESTNGQFQALIHNVPSIELVQCTTANDGMSTYPILLSCPTLSHLTVSCALPEFAKLSRCMKETSHNMAPISNLSLVLHCMLNDAMLKVFCEALSSSSSTNGTCLQHFSLQYLDITDDAWDMLWQSLQTSSMTTQQTLQSVTLAFTDNFVDAYRRLTPERRTRRSRAVWDMVQACPSLRHVTWPACQHDAVIVAEIESVLQARRE